jgi:hypothetical protein
MRGLALVLVWVLVAAACGDDGASHDAGGDDGAADAGPPRPIDVAPPAEPALPVFTPCPEGWVEQDRDGVRVCTPYPGGAPDACDDGLVHLPGDPGCRLLGTACPADGMPEGLPPGSTVWYVREGAAGDGTVATPFGTVSEALAVAGDDDVLAIAPGTYDEALLIGRPLTLWGACPTGVLLTSSIPDGAVRAGVVTIESAGVIVRNLAIGRSARPGVWAAVAGAEVELVDVIVAEADRVGIEVERGAHLTARGLIVRDTKPGATRQFGRGLGAQSGSQVEVSEALFERNHELGAVALDAGTSLVVRDAVLRDGLARESNGRDGLGLGALRGASARLTRAWVSHNTSGGVSGIDEGSLVELEDVWVLDTQPAALDGLYGRGLNAELGATLVARRVIVTGSHEGGVFANNAPSTVRLEDAIVDRTRPRGSDGLLGRGLGVQLGGALELSRVLIADSLESAIGAIGDGTALTMQDVVIRRTGPGPDGVGRGLSVENAASACAARVRIEESHGAGIMVQTRGASLELTDARIVGTLGIDGIAPARAIGVQWQGSARMTRVSLERNSQFGVIVIHEGSSLELDELTVEDTREHECGGGCVTGGTALGAFGGAALRATHLAIRGADLCGAHLGAGSEIDLAEGDVSACLVGACIQSDGYDVTRLSNGVRYHDNGTNLDATALPVPGPVSEIPAE